VDAMDFTVRKITEADKPTVEELISHWLTNFIISRGRKLYPAELPGFLAEDPDGKVVGLLTYEIIGDQCEVVTLDAFTQWSGIGTELMKQVERAARDSGCRRLWLITTNDNIEAIRFYQRRGLTIAAVHVNALDYSRELKPQIPKIGSFGIPMRDEIEFEMTLETGD
jgi:ribosomal protein S18 acetylase RimI-like enzyme